MQGRLKAPHLVLSPQHLLPFGLHHFRHARLSFPIQPRAKPGIFCDTSFLPMTDQIHQERWSHPLCDIGRTLELPTHTCFLPPSPSAWMTASASKQVSLSLPSSHRAARVTPLKMQVTSAHSPAQTLQGFPGPHEVKWSKVWHALWSLCPLLHSLWLLPPSFRSSLQGESSPNTLPKSQAQHSIRSPVLFPHSAYHFLYFLLLHFLYNLSSPREWQVRDDREFCLPCPCSLRSIWHWAWPVLGAQWMSFESIHGRDSEWRRHHCSQGKSCPSHNMV